MLKNRRHNRSHNNDVVSNVTEEASETKLKEAIATAKSQSKEHQSSNSGEIVLGPKSLESIVDATNLANEKTSNATVEIFCCLSSFHERINKDYCSCCYLIKMEEKSHAATVLPPIKIIAC